MNFGGRRTRSEEKLAVLEGLEPIATPFLLPALALNLASCQFPEPATLEAATTAAEFCKANAGRQLNFRNAKFVVYPPWMARSILGQSYCDPAVVAQVVREAHQDFRASLETEEPDQPVCNSTAFFRLSSAFSGRPRTAVSQRGRGPPNQTTKNCCPRAGRSTGRPLELTLGATAQIQTTHQGSRLHWSFLSSLREALRNRQSSSSCGQHLSEL